MTRVLAVSLVVVAGCALTSRSEPRELRTFAPELVSPASFAGPTCARIRIGRVVAGPSLRLAIQRRVSPVEVRAYETLRWTEPPDTYARSAIVHALFARPLEQAVTGPAHVLDVEVVAFEEVIKGTSRAGRVVLRYELRSTQRVLARGEAAVVRPASATAIDAVVAAIGDALTAASEQLADQVVATACT